MPKRLDPCDYGDCPFNAQGSEDCRYYCGLGVDEDEPEEHTYEELEFEARYEMIKLGPKDVHVGQIRYADLSPAIGKEIGGLRPVVIKEIHDDVVIVAPYHFGKPHPYQVRAIDYSRLMEKIQ